MTSIEEEAVNEDKLQCSNYLSKEEDIGESFPTLSIQIDQLRFELTN